MRTIRSSWILRLLGLMSFCLLPNATFGIQPPVSCPAGAPIGEVDLRVRSARGTEPLPLRTINRLEEGDVILYSPILHSQEKRKGEVSIVLVPAKRIPDEDAVLVLDPKSAEKPAEWKVPQIGWNQVNQAMRHPLWNGTDDGERFYFVHSYYVEAGSPELVAAFEPVRAAVAARLQEEGEAGHE